MGARIMMLFDGHCAALFTAEGRPTRFREHCDSRSALDAARGQVNRARVSRTGRDRARRDRVLSIERALASGRLDGDTEVEMRFEIDRAGGEFDFDRILTSSGLAADALPSSVAFGRVSGKVRIDGAARTVNGFAARGNVVHRTGTTEIRGATDALGVL